ncbi:MAG: helix-turn-helix domain-containing protein [Ruminiclostridium sp.]|nr:helix-turn-helix domain-containing protein [Ruminiclostridium sp.]
MGVYMGTKEAAEKWGCKAATVAKWCREGKIPKAEHDGKGSPWRIPADTERPTRKK